VIALLAVALAVTVIRSTRPSRGRLVVGAVCLLAVVVAAGHGYGAALLAGAFLTAAVTSAAVLLLHRRVMPGPGWAACAGSAA
jgi:hypothetical protein